MLIACADKAKKNMHITVNSDDFAIQCAPNDDWNDRCVFPCSSAHLKTELCKTRLFIQSRTGLVESSESYNSVNSFSIVGAVSNNSSSGLHS